MQLITFFLLLLFAFENFLLHRTSAEPCSPALPAAILARHNYYRTLHSSPPLALNSTLNSQAQQWAEQILATEAFRHRPNRRLSENLFRQVTPGTEAEVSAKTVVDAWYSESEFYGEFYGREPELATFSSWRYFTAMIWASSRELGVGCATKLMENDSNKRITYVVTNYSPRGNVVREFAENVRRPRVKTTTTSTTTTAYSTTYKSTSKTSYSTSTSTSKPPYRKPSPKPVSMPTKSYTPSTTAKPPPPPPFYSTAAAAADTKYRPKATTTTTTTTKAYQTTRKTSAIYSTTTAATKTYKTTTKAYKTKTTKTAYKKSTTTTKSPVKYTKYTKYTE